MRKVVLVDDEPLLRESLADLIAVIGYEVTTFSSIAAAKRAAFSADCGLVFCDWDLPGESTVDFCKQLKDASPDISFIVLTGYADHDKKQDAMLHGADRFEVKPMNMHLLEEILKKYL